MNDFGKEEEYGVLNNRVKIKSMNRPGYSYTPNVLNKAIEDIEMRKTKTKPPLISSKLPAVFEFPKFNKR
jgi:hypothetical protein